MLFNSYYFIFLFLPIALAGFYLLLRYARPDYAKIWLIFMSAWFYAYFSIPYFLLLLGSIAFNYFLCTKLWKYAELHNESGLRAGCLTAIRKRIFIIGVIANLGLLFVFKYYNFFIENVNLLLNGSFNSLTLLLPLGISFYTFQEISFLADTYRGETPKTKPIDFILFITFFPQLVAGPIIGHENLLPNIRELKWKQVDSEDIAKGLYLFCFGLFKKVVLADYLGKSVAYGYDHIATLDSGAIILTMLAFTLQLYLDFSGYSDMAIGLGRLFGFTLPMNFDKPFFSPTMIDFWKRWHITLYAFLTKNVYIPLGGNRKGKVRAYTNLFLSFFFSGLWHGAAWTYVLWGVLNGAVCVFTRAFMKQIKKLPEVLTGIVTFLLTSAFLAVFRCESLTQAGEFFGKLFSFTFTGLPTAFLETFRWPELRYVLKLFRLDYVGFTGYLCAAIIGVLLFLFLLFVEKRGMQSGRFELKAYNAVLIGVMFVWSVVSLSSVSVFLYFNF